MNAIKIQVFGRVEPKALETLGDFSFGLGPDCKTEVKHLDSWGSGEVILVSTKEPIHNTTMAIFERETRQLIPGAAIHFVPEKKSPKGGKSNG